MADIKKNLDKTNSETANAADEDLDGLDNETFIDDENTDDAATQDTSVEKTTQEEEQEPQKIPLSKLETKYIEERRKRQEAEAKSTAQALLLAQYQEKMEESDVTEYRQKKVQKYIGLGYEPEVASAMADDFTENYKISKSAARPAEGNRRNMEIASLKTKGEYYDNADAYAPKIIEQMDAFEKLGKPITAQQAYMLVVDPTQRQTELDQRRRAKASGNTNTSPDSTISSSATKPIGTTLSSADKDALQVLQRQDPNGVWTEKKYREIMKRHIT